MPPKYKWIVGKGCFESQGAAAPIPAPIPVPIPAIPVPMPAMPVPMPVPIPAMPAEFPTDAKIAKMKKDDIRDFINTMYTLIMQAPPAMPASLKKDALLAIAITARDRTKAALGSPRPAQTPPKTEIKRAMTEGDIVRLILSVGTLFANDQQGDFVLARVRADIGSGAITNVPQLKEAIVTYKRLYEDEQQAPVISKSMRLEDLNEIIVKMQLKDESLQVESDAQSAYVATNIENGVRSGQIADLRTLDDALRFYLQDYARAARTPPTRPSPVPPTRPSPAPPTRPSPAPPTRPIEQQLDDIQAPNVQSAEYRENIARIQKCLGLI